MNSKDQSTRPKHFIFAHCTVIYERRQCFKCQQIITEGLIFQITGGQCFKSTV